jgi:hypothetical protein
VLALQTTTHAGAIARAGKYGVPVQSIRDRGLLAPSAPGPIDTTDGAEARTHCPRSADVREARRRHLGLLSRCRPRRRSPLQTPDGRPNIAAGRLAQFSTVHRDGNFPSRGQSLPGRPALRTTGSPRRRGRHLLRAALQGVWRVGGRYRGRRGSPIHADLAGRRHLRTRIDAADIASVTMTDIEW